jgi:hypothetical protein
LANISGKYDRVLSEKEIYAVELPAMFNTLKSLSGGSMYLIRMTTPGTLSLYGSPIPTNQPISLHAGWNWIGYFGDVPLSIETALSSIAGQYQRVLSQDLYFDAANPEASSLTELVPNQGYMLYSNIDQVLTYPTAAQKVLGDKIVTSQSLCNKTITNTYTNIYGYFPVFEKTHRNNATYLVRIVTPTGIVAGCGDISNGLFKISRVFGQETINGITFPGFKTDEIISLELVDAKSGKVVEIISTNMKFSADLITHEIEFPVFPTPTVKIYSNPTIRNTPKPTVLPCAPKPRCLNSKPPCKITMPAGGWCNTL